MRVVRVIRIVRAVLQQMLAEARSAPEVECCGLLAGRAEVISVLLPARHGPRSASAYEISPPELFALFRYMRDAGLDHLGIYHSHSRGDNSPSRRDVELAYYPAAAYFIVSPQSDALRPVRAFAIADGRSEELTIDVVEE
jgi:proteasome lid subunit RPN8/RPN11